MAPDSLADFGSLVLAGIGIYAALIVLARVMGLRSFSKMSSFDFATTVAIGAILASTMLGGNTSLAAGATAFAVLFGLQFLVSKLRASSHRAHRILDSKPVVLIANGEVQRDHLDSVRMTQQDLNGKLRAGGVAGAGSVFAMVLETTGEVSILETGSDVDPNLFEGVVGAERLDFDSADDKGGDAGGDADAGERG